MHNYDVNAQQAATTHLLVTVLRRDHQSRGALRPNLVNLRPRLEQFPGDLIEMVGSNGVNTRVQSAHFYRKHVTNDYCSPPRAHFGRQT